MSSPLFRWTFETPKRPVQRTDSEETFYEEAEKDGMNDRTFKNGDMDTKALSQVPMLCNPFSRDSLANEELSQAVVSPSVPVARNSFPSMDSSAETLFGEEKLDAEVQTSLKISSHDVLLHRASHENTRNNQVDFEILTGLDDTQFNAYPMGHESQAISTDATFFEEKSVEQIKVENSSQHRSSSHENTCNKQEDSEMSPEILTDLDDTQFNAYLMEYKSQVTGTSSDATFLNEKNVQEIDLKTCGQFRYDSHRNTSNASDDFASSPEILTGLDDSQFNAYPIKPESDAPSTDATFFDVAENRRAAHAVEHDAFQKEEILECGDAVPNNSAELRKTLPGTLAFDRLVPSNQNESTGTPEAPGANAGSGACSNTDLSQDIVEFIENMPVCPTFDMSEFNEFMGEFTNTFDQNDRSGSSTLDETANIFAELHLSSVFLDDRSSSPEDSRRTSNNHHVVKKQKRVLSPQNFGENKRRKTIDLKTAQHLRPIGKPSLSRMRLVEKSLTPCHPMNLRSRNDRSAECTPKRFTPECYTCISKAKSCKGRRSHHFVPDYASTNSWKERDVNKPKIKFSSQIGKTSPQIFSPRSVRNKKSGQGKKNSDIDPDCTDANGYQTRKENFPRSLRKSTQTPSSDVSINKQGKTIPKRPLKVSFVETPDNEKAKRGRPRKIVENDFNTCVPGSDEVAGKQSGWSTDEHFISGSYQSIGKSITVQQEKLSVRRSSSGAENSVNDPWVQLSGDEIDLRKLRKRLLDLIFDETPISNAEAEKMTREIKEKQQRIQMWNQPGVEGDKVCRLVKELEVLCDNMLYQIGTLKASSNTVESGGLLAPENNHRVRQRNDPVSPSPYQEHEPQNIAGWSFPTKSAEVGSKKSSLFAKRREREHTPVSQEMIPATKGKGSASYCSGERGYLRTPGNFVSLRSNIPPPSPSPRQKLKNITRKSFFTKEQVGLTLKKSNLGRTEANLRGRKGTGTPTKDAAKVPDLKHPDFTRVLMDKAHRGESPRRPPVKLVSNQVHREDTLTEQNLYDRTKQERNFGSVERNVEHAATNVCFACGASSTKDVADIGINTDLVEPREKVKEKVLVDRSTNTDPEDYNRVCKRKALVDCGTNTELHYRTDPKPNLMINRKKWSPINKENFGTELDFKNITQVWLPRPEDFLPCSYDNLSLETLSNPSTELPLELIDDLTWDD